MIRTIERSSFSPSGASFAIFRLAAPRLSTQHISHTSSLRTPVHLATVQFYQHRNFQSLRKFKDTLKQEANKDKDLIDAVEKMKEKTETVKDHKIVQEVFTTANVSVKTGKGIWATTRTYIASLNLGSRALNKFEKTSDTLTEAVSTLKQKKDKFYPGSKAEVEVKDETKAEEEAKGSGEPMATTATPEAEANGKSQEKVVAEDIKPESEHIKVSQEDPLQEPVQAGGQEGEAKEAEKEKVYDLVPVIEKKKSWFSISLNSSSLAKTVERIRLLNPSFSIVDFMDAINPLHRHFLIALYTQNVGMLAEVAVPDFVERIAYTVQPLKPGEQPNQCHVIELYDAELDSTDPERIAIKVTFEAQIVVTSPDGTVVNMALDRSDSATQVTQLRGAFEWIFEDVNPKIHDFTVYTMEPIY